MGASSYDTPPAGPTGVEHRLGEPTGTAGDLSWWLRPGLFVGEVHPGGAIDRPLIQAVVTAAGWPIDQPCHPAELNSGGLAFVQ